jgi:hypothetical protein
VAFEGLCIHGEVSSLFEECFLVPLFAVGKALKGLEKYEILLISRSESTRESKE